MVYLKRREIPGLEVVDEDPKMIICEDRGGNKVSVAAKEGKRINTLPSGVLNSCLFV